MGRWQNCERDRIQWQNSERDRWQNSERDRNSILEVLNSIIIPHVNIERDREERGIGERDQ